MIGALVAGITGSGGASLSSYESIATATGTGSNSSVTFSSIPSTYKHLQIRILARNTNAGTSFSTGKISLNGNTTTADYAFHELYGDGATAAAYGVTSYLPQFFVAQNGNTSGIMSTAIVDILDYGSTTKNKTIRIFQGFDKNGTGGYIEIASGLWIQTTAISSISLYAAGTSTSTYFTTDTIIALYGIKEA